MNYTPNVRKSAQTFVNVLQKAKEWFASLSKTEQQNLIDELEHGAGHLTNIRQLNAYIAKYGEIHQAKFYGIHFGHRLSFHTPTLHSTCRICVLLQKSIILIYHNI